MLGPTFEALKTKNYQHSEFIEPQLTTLTEITALVRGVAVRYQASGTELERVPMAPDEFLRALHEGPCPPNLEYFEQLKKLELT
jgi:hypothetical protein